MSLDPEVLKADLLVEVGDDGVLGPQIDRIWDKAGAEAASRQPALTGDVALLYQLSLARVRAVSVLLGQVWKNVTVRSSTGKTIDQTDLSVNLRAMLVEARADVKEVEAVVSRPGVQVGRTAESLLAHQVEAIVRNGPRTRYERGLRNSW